MKILLILILITFTISTPPPEFPEPSFIFHEYYLNDTLLQGSHNIIITKSKLITTLYTDGEISTLSYSIKAVNLPKNVVVDKYSIVMGKQGSLTVQSLTLNNKKISYRVNGKRIDLMKLNFGNGRTGYIEIKYKIKNTALFGLFHYEPISMVPGNNYPGTIIVYCSNKLELFGSKEGKFYKTKKGNYEWTGKVGNKGFSDAIMVGIKAAGWKILYYGSIKNGNPINNYNAKFSFTKYFKGGNNILKFYEISNNHGKTLDGKNIIKKNANYILNSKGREPFYKISSEFKNIVSSNWKIDLKEYNYKSTATELTKKKAKEILSNDKSHNPIYIKLGRWVNKNIKYSLSYTGRKMSVNEILQKRIGVCEHITQLYNALLHSLNIGAIYTIGYAFGDSKNLNDLKGSYHAWSIVKIDNVWKPVDATWGIFAGKLPVSHVFESYFDSSLSYSACAGCGRLNQKKSVKYLGPK